MNQDVLNQLRTTPPKEVDRCLTELVKAGRCKARSSIDKWIELAEACLDGVVQVAPRWVDLACRAKGIPPSSPMRVEEITAGPVATARHLRLLILGLREFAATGRSLLPKRAVEGPDGRLRVRLIPINELYDQVVFVQFRAEAWMQKCVTREQFQVDWAAQLDNPGEETAKVSLILGAGNVSSIPATDAFTKIFQEGRVVLLKMNPVNDYLGPIFQQALAPLIDAGYLRIVYGGADVGEYGISHDLVDEVHITGSIETHHAIVWGPAGSQRERRLSAQDPLLTKPITSELGNVSPWIIVPGPYSDRELHFQAENVAASIVNNASFNCLATKVIVTWTGWQERQRFLDDIQQILDKVPRRKAYYPGAMDRFRRVTGHEPDEQGSGTLPWTLIRDVDPDDSPRFLEQESFVCVCVEVGLDAATETQFLERATDFVNERLWGTLCAAVTVHPKFRRRADHEAVFQSSLSKLKYGAIGINHWPGLIYAMMSPPWGGYPGATLADAQSGIGWVHNTFMLQGVEKTVLEGPLTVWPKPTWFPTHRSPEPVAWRLLRLYHRPSLWKLITLTCRALVSSMR